MRIKLKINKNDVEPFRDWELERPKNPKNVSECPKNGLECPKNVLECPKYVLECPKNVKKCFKKFQNFWKKLKNVEKSNKICCLKIMTLKNQISG